MIRTLLIAVALAVIAPIAQAARLEPDARIVWDDADPEFGGFSGIEVRDNGAGFVAIGDRGVWATGRMIREDGRLIGVENTGFGPLRAVSGRPVEPPNDDAEGLALDDRGRFYVSFEGFHRIRRYDAIDEAAQSVPRHPDFRRLQNNSGLEALAVDGDGALFAIPERSGRMTRPFPVYRLRDGVWTKPFAIPRIGSFLVAGADFGPEGDLYLLERDFRWSGGFATRIRRFALGADGLDGGETLHETDFGSTDNFEGISVWRDPEGHTRVTLVADDNFFTLQSTVIAEFLLIED